MEGFGFGGTGKKSALAVLENLSMGPFRNHGPDLGVFVTSGHRNKFADYGVPFEAGDVVTCCLDSPQQQRK